MISASTLCGDMPISIALGVNPLARAGAFVLGKTGRNTDIDTATAPEDLCDGGGVYTGFPVTGSAETLEVFSSDANDTAAGTGARTLRLFGLDANYVQITEDVTLNGVTPVTTTQTFWRMHRAQVLTAGSGGFNAGTITVRHSTTTANVFCVVPIGYSRSQMGGYTVPANHVAVLLSLYTSVQGGTTAHVDGALWTRDFGQAAGLMLSFTANNSVPNILPTLFGSLVFPGKSDFIPRIVSSDTNNVEVASFIQFLVVPNAALDYLP